MKKVSGKNLSIVLLAGLCFVLLQKEANAQNGVQQPQDSVYLKAGDFLYRNDSFQVIRKDTLMYLESGEYKVDKENFEKTQRLYDSLANRMDKSWITKEIYSALFSSVARSSIDKGRGDHFVSKVAFEQYSGKQIRNIYLSKVDVIEGSVDDTLLIATSNFAKLANDIHINSRDWVIRQYLLFRKGEYINPYVLSDNERIIRSLEFIEDARIVVRETDSPEGEVDIYVVTKDVFSIGVGGSFRGFDNLRAEVFDKNIFGVGNELRVGIIYNDVYPRPFGYGLAWDYNNIVGTLTDASLQYYNTYDIQYLRQIFRKEFLTPEIKYGGELDIGWRKDILFDFEPDTIYQNRFELKYMDVWLGRSFLLNTKDRRTNIIVGARYTKNSYLSRPETALDTNVYFRNSDNILFSLSLKKLNYFKSHKILGFGVIEDIPYGFISRILAGNNMSEFFDRPYFGVQQSFGKYVEKFGYIWFDSKFGSFWKGGSVNELLFNFNVVYYTPLYDLGRYESRFLAKASYNSGLNYLDNRALNFFRGLRNFDDRALSGLGSYTFGIDGILFTPWYVYGFKFAPYAFVDLGLLSDKGFGIENGDIFSSFGIGLRIRNESLVFNTISFHFSYIPRQVRNAPHFFLDASASRPLLFNDVFDDKPTFNTLEIN